METQARRTLFLDRPQMQLAHCIIRVGRDGLDGSFKGTLRSLEGKILACKLSAYNGFAHVLTLTESEMYALRHAHQEYCAQMADYLRSHQEHLYTKGHRTFEQQLDVALAYRNTEALTLHKYAEASELLRVFSSL